MSQHHANFHRPDSGIHTVEGNVAGARAAQLAKKRQDEQDEFAAKKKLKLSNNSRGMRFDFEQANATLTASEQAFRVKTVGLVTAEEFLLAQQQQQQQEDSNSMLLTNEAIKKPNKNKNKNKKLTKKQTNKQNKVWSTLSFANDEEVRVMEDLKPTVSSLKDPTVDTSFLPDKQRDITNQLERQRLKIDWEMQQDIIRQESLEITYSYWDGSGHRRCVTLKKGDTIGTFLELVRKDLSKEFRELLTIGCDALIYVKEDLMLPSDLTFYDLIVTKARGKSGPLFHFDVHDDLRLGPLDSRVEKEESHPGKVVARQWYDRNKHIFPASRWELYDPNKTYANDRYTIHGDSPVVNSK